MSGRKTTLGIFLGLLFVLAARAEVRVSIAASNLVAWVRYSCTTGEVVRAFALDVSVDRGTIMDIFGFFRGESRAAATGYGIFPASYRGHLLAAGDTNVDWQSSDYAPLATVADAPGGTLPGLNSAGVTLEFGSLWDPTVPAATPPATGILCGLRLSEPANVSVATNAVRGGIVSAVPENPMQTVLVGAPVGPLITGSTVQNRVITVLFNGGELQTAPGVEGPWTDTGDTSGTYVEQLGTDTMKFYRVRSP